MKPNLNCILSRLNKGVTEYVSGLTYTAPRVEPMTFPNMLSPVGYEVTKEAVISVTFSQDMSKALLVSHRGALNIAHNLKPKLGLTITQLNTYAI